MTTKRFPLAKRFSAALSDKAYERLRELNRDYGYGNNYLLTILLEHLDEVVDHQALDGVFEKFAAEYGSPKSKSAGTGER